MHSYVLFSFYSSLSVDPRIEFVTRPVDYQERPIKCEVANEDNSEEEEDEVLDFTKQKSEIIFWNDPRMGMKKKDITLSSLAKSMGIMTIMVTDTEEDKKVKEDRLKLKEVEEEAGPLERWQKSLSVEFH